MGFETDNQWTPPVKGTLNPKIRRELAVWKEDIINDKPLLVDSRDYKRYIGEHEPIDSIAGHIPGAMCMPYLDNVDENGKWKSKKYFEDKFSSLAQPPVTPVFYCGSGVTACHNILAYKIATDKDAKLYGGSYSEWINYYPVATGD